MHTEAAAGERSLAYQSYAYVCPNKGASHSYFKWYKIKKPSLFLSLWHASVDVLDSFRLTAPTSHGTGMPVTPAITA